MSDTSNIAAAPTILLIRPQMAENIGAAARAMRNFGLEELRLVAPRQGWPHPKAAAMATSAVEILDRAALFDDSRAAVADIQHLYATTARPRDMDKRVVTPRQAMQEIRDVMARGERAALMFGPERTGLENDDVVMAQAIISIPTAPDHASLNVAQALVVVAYEWFLAAGDAPPPAARACESGHAPASQFEIQGLFDHLEAELDHCDFFKSAAKKPNMWQNLRNLFLKASLSEQDVRTLRGVIRALRDGPRG